jgi:NADH-quinone oxidoreductase subunit N
LPSIAAIVAQLGCLWLALSAESMTHVAAAQVGTLAAAGFLIANNCRRSPDLEAAELGTDDEQLDDGSARVFIAGAISIVCLLLATALMFALTGTLELTQIQSVLRNSYRPDHADMIVGDASRLGVAAIVLLFAATGLQFSLPPFQVTLSNVFENCPAGVASFIAIVQRLHAAAVIWKLGVLTLVGFESTVQIVALVCAAAAAVIGTATVCRTESLRGLAGGLWTTSASLLFLALAIGVTSPLRQLAGEQWQLPDGIETAGLIVTVSSLALLALLACEWCASIPERRIDFHEDLAGLGRQRPLIAVPIAAAFLTFSAIPPLPGFWAFGFLVASAFIPGLTDRALVPNSAILLAVTVVGVSLLIVNTRLVRLFSLIFLHEPLRRFRSSVHPAAQAIPAVLAVLLIWIGLFPRSILDHLHQLLR